MELTHVAGSQRRNARNQPQCVGRMLRTCPVLPLPSTPCSSRSFACHAPHQYSKHNHPAHTAPHITTQTPLRHHPGTVQAPPSRHPAHIEKAQSHRQQHSIQGAHQGVVFLDRCESLLPQRSTDRPTAPITQSSTARAIWRVTQREQRICHECYTRQRGQHGESSTNRAARRGQHTGVVLLAGVDEDLQQALSVVSGALDRNARFGCCCCRFDEPKLGRLLSPLHWIDLCA